MNQFPTLIEYLLLNHDYVVIPGIGTFIVQQVNSQRNELEEAFLPPYRSVRFNTELKQDDALLLNSIQSIFSTSPQQAEQMLATWVNDFRMELEDNGCMEFGSLGVFTVETGDAIAFSAQESGVVTPEYYGLDVFHMSEIASAGKARIVPMTATMEADEHEITIRINRRIANYVVAACAAILLFLVFNNPMPGFDTDGQRSSVSELLVPKTTTEQPKAEFKTEEKKVVADLPKVEAMPKAVEATEPETKVAEPVAPQPQAAEQTPELPQAKYCIVLASAISRANAERFVKQLTADGFISARILSSEKMTRVVVGRYTNEAEAQSAASKIRQQSKDYSSAWVYKL